MAQENCSVNENHAALVASRPVRLPYRPPQCASYFGLVFEGTDAGPILVSCRQRPTTRTISGSAASRFHCTWRGDGPDIGLDRGNGRLATGRGRSGAVFVRRPAQGRAIG